VLGWTGGGGVSIGAGSRPTQGFGAAVFHTSNPVSWMTLVRSELNRQHFVPLSLSCRVDGALYWMNDKRWATRSGGQARPLPL
jgi:hypothetical protein